MNPVLYQFIIDMMAQAFLAIFISAAYVHFADADLRRERKYHKKLVKDYNLTGEY